MEDKLEEPTVIQAGEHSMVWDFQLFMVWNQAKGLRGV